jgi:hypothetical protein
VSNRAGCPAASKRRTQASRALVAVLSGLAAFAALQVGAALAAEFLFPELIDPSYGALLQRIRQVRGADPEHTRTVVMLGSSRTYFGLQPDAMNGALTREVGRPISVVNAGATGAGPLTELFTWRRLHRDGVRPDLLLIEVLPAFLSRSFPIDEVCANRMSADRLRWSDLPLLQRYIRTPRPTLRRDVALAGIGGVYNHRIGILFAVAPGLLTGQGPTDAPLVAKPGPGLMWTDPSQELRSKALAEARREYADTLQAAPAAGSGCDALRELLAACRRDGVPAALVVMPEGPVFRSWYAPETWKWIQAWLEQVAHENGAALINAREWIAEDEFMDSHHLLPRGADRFSERLGREYILPLVRRGEETRP